MTNPVHNQQKKIENEFDQPILKDFRAETAAEACLRPLLMAMGWTGLERHIFEAMPHFDRVESMDDLRAVLARLNYDTSKRKMQLSDISLQQFPCLYASKGKLYVLISYEDDGSLTAFDGQTQEFVCLPAGQMIGDIYLIEKADIDKLKDEIRKNSWLFVVMSRFRRMLVMIFGISLLINTFALAVPIFVMSVYNKAIGAKSTEILLMFIVGICLVLATELMLRIARSKAQAYFGARLDALLGSTSFQQLLHLPIAMTENAPIGAQITRLKQFETIRDTFTGPLANAIVDLPFILIFLSVIALIGGPVVWIPIILMLVYGVMGLISFPLTQRNISRAGEIKNKTQNLIIEALSKQRAINNHSAVNVWVDKFAKLSSEGARQNFKSQQLNLAVQTLAQLLVSISGVATLGVGAIMVIEGNLSPGALIGIMALIWRVLSPLRQTFLSLSRLGMTLQSFSQINRLMQLALERDPGVLPSMYRHFDGHIKVLQLSFRYPNNQDAVLRGVDFEIKPGEVLAITGPSGSGKTTLLNNIIGLYQPQAGAVFIDGLDVRQLDPGQWRQAIGYTPEAPMLFYGTIAQNLRLANPSATREELEKAAADADLLGHSDFPDGIETRLTSSLLASIPDAIKQRIVLARAYVKDVPFYMFDNPGNSLDIQGDQAFLAKINRLKGDKTVILVTHRPSHMRAADRLIYMDKGQAVLDGPPDDVLAQLTKAA